MQSREHRPCRVSPWVAWLCGCCAIGLAAVPALAGGSGENALIVIDPSNAESMYIGNYYKSVRNVPDRNVLYMSPGAANYASFAASNLDALFGSLVNLHIDDHIDYVLVAPGGSFYVSASGYVTDGCSPVTRFAASSVYTTAFLESEILGGTSVDLPNRFYSTTDTARAFDNSLGYYNGSPNTSPAARRYFIGALLGYTGLRGNTLTEIVDMIDRSVTADCTRPMGTFYFMETTDALRSGPRHGYFDAAVAAILAVGGSAEHLLAVLPIGRHDCLGIMTGWASPDIDGADMTILPGAFCDHLTSWAATFDISSQTKISRWIVKGASGSVGAVEEPCNYPGKFPHARIHVYYYQGVSLGEAYLRSAEYVPFQMLLYGDPLTQPFAYLPVVTVPDAPAGPVSGTITLTPSATTAKPGAVIAFHELYVDGRLKQSVSDGQAFSLNTTTLADGAHDVRVVSYDNTLVASQGRWLGQIVVANQSRTVTLSVLPSSGDRSTLFTVSVSAAGGTVTEVRLLHNNRVVAAAPTSQSFSLLGEVFGAGPVKLIAEAEFSDQTRAQSEPAAISIAYANPPDGAIPNNPPVAHSYAKDVPLSQPMLLELPASDLEDGILTWTIHTLPQYATVEGAGPVVLLRPMLVAQPSDTLTFSVSDGQASSNTATVTLRYLHEEGDISPPTPNPMTWELAPRPASTSTIEMIGSLATDPSGVQYLFATGAGQSLSGWQALRTYLHSGLAPNALVSYKVKARDLSPNLNQTAYSTPTWYSATAIETPTGVAFSNVTDTSMDVTALGTFTNLSAGESGLFFEMTPAVPGSGANVWTQGTANTTIHVTGLTPGTTYTFRVKARNFWGSRGGPYETPWVGPVGQQTTGGATCSLLGDVNDDGLVDGGDIAGFVRAKLGLPALPGENQACADYGGTLDQDLADFVADLLN